MPYKLTKQEKEFIRRQYQENVRIINSLLPPERRISRFQRLGFPFYIVCGDRTNVKVDI